MARVRVGVSRPGQWPAGGRRNRLRMDPGGGPPDGLAGSGVQRTSRAVLWGSLACGISGRVSGGLRARALVGFGAAIFSVSARDIGDDATSRAPAKRGRGGEWDG